MEQLVIKILCASFVPLFCECENNYCTSLILALEVHARSSESCGSTLLPFLETPQNALKYCKYGTWNNF